VLFLATETVRLILGAPTKAVKPSNTSRNATQQRLINDPAFISLLHLPRKKFKQALRQHFGKKGKILANGCVLYDQRRKALLTRPQSVAICKGKPSLNGFRQPTRKWTPVTEKQRHEAAINRANGF
jgi:hypothetical protein